VDPTLFIHGIDDELIPASHSEELFKLSPAGNKVLNLCENADHNVWDIRGDVLSPIQSFLQSLPKLPEVEEDFIQKIPEKMGIPPPREDAHQGAISSL